jgi:hypothetical protein
MSPVLASMVLSMLATPFIIMYSEPHRDAPVGQRLADAVGAADHASPRRPSAPRST